MLIKAFRFLFSKIIGNLPAEQKAQFWAKFNVLLMEVVKAAAQGAVAGATKK